ncbi:MAG: amidohydrolase [Candidatus Heimdallarchaeota archaeon]|nr:amidohydrolase [Candidatus Heimdallarchaeota archaeon]MDH5644530.1 amidohydrolase [Candidatus Heimdallarchaeota archaeon]
MSSFVIKPKWILHPQGSILENQIIHIEDNTFTYIGKYDGSKIPHGTDVYTFDKGLVVPPFVNAHTHIPETLIRGICDDQDLHEWLYNHVWKVEPQMNKHDAKIGALLGIAEMIQSGTIGFIDQFYFSNEIADAVSKTGVKAYLAPSIFEGNSETKTSEHALDKNIEVLKKWHGYDNRIFIGFGPHAPYSVDDEMYTRIFNLAEEYDTIIHTHLSETSREVNESKEKYDKSPIQKMHDLGILKRIIAAHCVHVSDEDLQILYKNRVTVLHNIQSNLKLGSGIARIPDMIAKGINVCLGTDGSASNNNLDMLEEVRLNTLIHKGLNSDPKLINSLSSLKMGTSNASKIFPNNSYSGEIKVGDPADLIVVDLSSVNNTPVINPISNWIFSSYGNNINMTIANGTILYENGEFMTLDIADIKTKAQKSIERMMSSADYNPKIN